MKLLTHGLAGIAMILATQAHSISFSLTQIGGTYDGVSANPGDTLTLQIDALIEGGDVGRILNLIDPGLGAVGGVTFGSGVAGTEPAFFFNPAMLNSIVSPTVVAADIAEVAPAPGFSWQADGWEVANAAGALIVGEGTIPLGTVDITLDGTPGFISTATDFNPFGTQVYLDFFPSYDHFPGEFEILAAVPEPGTALLIAIGLLGLRGRRR